MTFIQELRSVINRHSKENASDTPDFILAQYLNSCLKSFDYATKARTKWFCDTKDRKDQKQRAIKRTRMRKMDNMTKSYKIGKIVGQINNKQRQ